MAWINFREVQDRFSHIDAQFVSSNIQFGPGGAEVSVTVRFYPWWEHPLYVAARDAGESWGFQDTDEGARDVVVKAVGAIAVKLAPDSMVDDWAFSAEHPVLWGFAQRAVVYVNGPFDVRELTDRLLARKMAFVERSHLSAYLDPDWAPVASRGISLPTQLQRPVLEELAAMNVPVFVPGLAGEAPKLVLFLMDASDYVVAEDFVIDVPEFKHEPGWFKSVSGRVS